MKEKVLKVRDLIRANWNDPVWSKVISGVILALGGVIISLLIALYGYLKEKIPFGQAFKAIYNYLAAESKFNNSVIIVAVSLVCWNLIKFIWAIIQKAKQPVESSKPKSLPAIHEHSTVFFSYRLAKAFPGQRGLQWYDDKKDIVKRLSVLLQEPLRFKSTADCPGDPIWWFRSSAANHITSFKRLDKTKVLMMFDELEIRRIAVNVDKLYYKSYIYVEVSPSPPTGLYEVLDPTYKQEIETFGCAWEEYGLFKNKPITRQEYDDGAAMIKGKLVDTDGAELRSRYVTDYNFLMSAKQSPFNSQRFSSKSRKYFDGLLNGTVSHVDFFSFLDTFEKHER